MFKTPYNYDYSKVEGEVNTLPSETRQSDFEPLSVLVDRVCRGQIRLPDDSEDYYEYTGDDEPDLDVDNPLDEPGFDVLDAGSIYEDEISSKINELVNQPEQTSDFDDGSIIAKNAQATSETEQINSSSGATLPE